MKIKTIDVNALEWFDKVYGNSYFSGTITLNYGMKNAKEYKMPFQYGSGDQYIFEAGYLLYKEGVIKLEKHQVLWRYCKDNNIVLRTDKKENCLKRELLNNIL